MIIEIQRNNRIIKMWDFVYYAMMNCKGAKI